MSQRHTQTYNGNKYDMDGKELKNKAFAQGKKHLYKEDKYKSVLRNIYEVQCYQHINVLGSEDAKNRPKFSFGLAHTLCIAGLWAYNYDSKQATVYYPKLKDGTECLRVDDLTENFDGVQNMNAEPHLSTVYDSYLPSNECDYESELDKKTRFSCAMPGDTKTYMSFAPTFGTDNNDHYIPCNIDRCFEPYWALPKPMYKYRNPIIEAGYHFASSNPNKTMSAKFREKFEADYPTSRFDFFKFKGKLDKVIRQMSKVKEFHGTLGGLSFLALSMDIPTTIWINKRHKLTAEEKMMKHLAKRSGAKFKEADI